MHLAAKMLASQAVPELMPGNDEQHNRQNHWISPPLKEARNVLNHISPISPGDTNSAQNSDCGQDKKCRCKAKLHLADQIIEEPVWIEGSESQIQQAALDTLCGRLYLFGLAAVQQARCGQGADECIQFFSR